MQRWTLLLVAVVAAILAVPQASAAVVYFSSDCDPLCVDPGPACQPTCIGIGPDPGNPCRPQCSLEATDVIAPLPATGLVVYFDRECDSVCLDPGPACNPMCIGIGPSDPGNPCRPYCLVFGRDPGNL